MKRFIFPQTFLVAILSLILVFSIIGCGSSSKRTPTIYTAGYYIIGGHKPGYWTNSTLKLLTLPEGVSAGDALCIFGSSGQIYIGGSYGSPSIPCYWKNTDMSLVNLLPESSTEGRVSSIYVSGNKIYSGGYHDTLPCYWVDDIRVPTNLPIPGATMGRVQTIAVKNGTIYAGGFYLNDGLAIPCYWVGAEGIGNDPVGLLPDGALEGYINSIFVADGVIYTAGGYDMLAGVEFPCYWIGDNKDAHELPLPVGINKGEVDSILISGGTFHAAGYYMDIDNKNFPCYWTGTVGQPPSRVDLLPTDAIEGRAQSIQCLNGTIYIAGYYLDSGSRYIPCYWTSKDLSNPVSLSLPEGATGGMANEIFVK